MIGADGLLKTIAGNGKCDYAGDSGAATDAALKNAKGMVVDSRGTVYIADYDNCRIRKVENGIISTAAGSTCDVVDPFGIAIDSADNIYLADAGNSRVQLFSGGQLTVIAAAPDIATAEGVAVDASGNLYIADTFDCVIKEIPGPVTGPVTGAAIKTVAGNGTCGYSGEGRALDEQLNYPAGVAVDGAGDVYVADTVNCRIRKISGGEITTVAGNGACHTASPTGLAVAPNHDVYVSDSFSLDCHVLKIAADGTVSRVAGLATIDIGGGLAPCAFSDDATATSARLNHPTALALDSAGAIYVADTVNCRVRKVIGGAIETVVGFGSCAYGGDGGPATRASMNGPKGLAVDAAGTLYIGDTGNCAIRIVDNPGNISTIAGGDGCGFSGDGGPATAAKLNQPQGLSVDATGNVFVADTQNCRIREIDASSKTITTVAGSGTCGNGGDGGDPSDALLNHPSDVAVGAFGELYIADTDNCRVREVSADRRLILTVAGSGECAFGGDNASATSASFDHPGRVAVDTDGNIYIADSGNGRVRVVSAPDTDGNGFTDVQDLEAGRDPFASVTVTPSTTTPAPMATAAATATSGAPAPATTGGSGSSTGLWIIIGVLGGVIALAAAVAVVWYTRKRSTG